MQLDFHISPSDSPHAVAQFLIRLAKAYCPDYAGEVTAAPTVATDATSRTRKPRASADPVAEYNAIAAKAGAPVVSTSGVAAQPFVDVSQDVLAAEIVAEAGAEESPPISAAIAEMKADLATVAEPEPPAEVAPFDREAMLTHVRSVLPHLGFAWMREHIEQARGAKRLSDLSDIHLAEVHALAVAGIGEAAK